MALKQAFSHSNDDDRKHVKALMEFFKYGAKKHNTTPLGEAVIQAPKTIQLLLNNGWKVNEEDDAGNTPLQYCCFIWSRQNNNDITQK